MAGSTYSFWRRIRAVFSPVLAHPALALTDDEVLEHRANMIIAHLSRRVSKLESDMIALRLRVRRQEREGRR